MTRNWPERGMDLETYRGCFQSALRRIVATLMVGKPGSPVKEADLRKTDDHLEKLFRSVPALTKLSRTGQKLTDELSDNEERAEDFFYSSFRFVPHSFPVKSGQKIAAYRIVHEPTDTFIQWSYKRLHQPTAKEATPAAGEFKTPLDFARHCATNYLVKNFWHNFVHEVIQGITLENYSKFRGETRFQSDFEADNLATIFFVLSYGLPVNTSGLISLKSKNAIDTLFARNRCNQVFDERARHREADQASMSREEAWADYEWRNRRRLANALSQRLILQGSAATRLSIDFCGSLNCSQTEERFWRNGPVVGVVNGRHIAIPVPPYLPSDDPSLKPDKLTDQRKRDISQFRENRNDEIVIPIASQYRDLLKHHNEKLGARAALNHILFRIGYGDLIYSA